MIHTNTTIPICHIRFDAVKLEQREGHKLRGFFGNYFKTHSPLLHNHYADGTFRQGYPLVQYKVLQNIPTLVGLGEGANLLNELFRQVNHLQIEGRYYAVNSKQVKLGQMQLGLDTTLSRSFTFASPWLALNEINHKRWKQSGEAKKQEILNAILIGNILAFYKGMGVRLSTTERVKAQLEVVPVVTRFKNIAMTAFKGTFTTNTILPEWIGLGKSVSRGYGAIENSKVLINTTY